MVKTSKNRSWNRSTNSESFTCIDCISPEYILTTIQCYHSPLPPQSPGINVSKCYGLFNDCINVIHFQIAFRAPGGPVSPCHVRNLRLHTEKSRGVAPGYLSTRECRCVYLCIECLGWLRYSWTERLVYPTTFSPLTMSYVFRRFCILSSTFHTNGGTKPVANNNQTTQYYCRYWCSFITHTTITNYLRLLGIIINFGIWTRRKRIHQTTVCTNQFNHEL